MLYIIIYKMIIQICFFFIIYFCILIVCDFIKNINTNKNNSYEFLNEIKSEQPNTKNPLKVVDPYDAIDILQDANFKDTKFYTNNDDPYTSGNGLGLQKCFNECNGVCVEFGVTGNAFCFKKIEN